MWVLDLPNRRATLGLPTRRATTKFGRALATLLAPGDVVLLEGPLGAGKTFLARAIARGLGVPPAVAVQSPTFGLMHQLEGRIPIVHADLYRLSRGAEVDEIGLADAMAGRVTIVEWGRELSRAIAEDYLEITLSRPIDVGRAAAIGARGPRSTELLASLGRALAGPGHPW